MTSPIQLCYAWHQADCRVTITGADDKVDPEALVELSEKYPFVEWGILASEGRSGTNRYPTWGWARVATSLLARSGSHFAIHLCGEYARRYQRNETEAEDFVDSLTSDVISPTQCRVQINGFDHRLDGFEPANPFVPYILPVNRRNVKEALARRYGFNAQFLFDESGGRGVKMDVELAFGNVEVAIRTGSQPRKTVGIAGGINEENIAKFAMSEAYMSSYVYDLRDCWVDLESGVRTNNEFDMAKAEAVLQAASKAFG